MAFETLTEPTYLDPQEPDIPVKFIIDTDDWSKNVKNWKNNCSCMFASVLQHCTVDLVQWLKSKDLWSVTNLGKDLIALAKMIRDVAHAHDNTPQGTMAI
eukprot:4121914-Ditylum_brightwellii.AAC.1